jgi:mRNA-degrading endonuclease RelE of RelBE toxin-antitoxin system
MPYQIEVMQPAAEELKGLRAFDQRRIVDEIEVKLRDEPTQPSRNQKWLPGLVPAFPHTPPVWELRVGDYRVFYDVDADAEVVHVRAVRHKGQGQTTEDIVT